MPFHFAFIEVSRPGVHGWQNEAGTLFLVCTTAPAFRKTSKCVHVQFKVLQVGEDLAI